MNKRVKRSRSRVAEFVAHRIHELRMTQSQSDIAAAAGFASPNMLSMIKEGKAKLPLERAIRLAAALECNPRKLILLALEDTMPPAVLLEISRSPEATEANVAAISMGIETRAARSQLRRLKAYLSHALTEWTRSTADLRQSRVSSIRWWH